jgi:hypothetical protein
MPRRRVSPQKGWQAPDWPQALDADQCRALWQAQNRVMGLSDVAMYEVICAAAYDGADGPSPAQVRAALGRALKGARTFAAALDELDQRSRDLVGVALKDLTLIARVQADIATLATGVEKTRGSRLVTAKIGRTGREMRVARRVAEVFRRNGINFGAGPKGPAVSILQCLLETVMRSAADPRALVRKVMAERAGETGT